MKYNNFIRELINKTINLNINKKPKIIKRNIINIIPEAIMQHIFNILYVNVPGTNNKIMLVSKYFNKIYNKGKALYIKSVEKYIIDSGIKPQINKNDIVKIGMNINSIKNNSKNYNVVYYNYDIITKKTFLKIAHIINYTEKLKRGRIVIYKTNTNIFTKGILIRSGKKYCYIYNNNSEKKFIDNELLSETYFNSNNVYKVETKKVRMYINSIYDI